ncbi:MAG: hypothetical protein ABIQ66_05760, partial [Novosphingobium sp.]
MRVRLLACAAIVAAVMPVAALADDPRDPAMRSAAARERDREGIRQLNLNELAMVRDRDAQYAPGWAAAATRKAQLAQAPADYDANAEYDAQSRDHRQDMADYASSRAAYQQQLANWRRAVAECRQGNY